MSERCGWCDRANVKGRCGGCGYAAGREYLGVTSESPCVCDELYGGIDIDRLTAALETVYASNLGQMEIDSWGQMAQKVAREYAEALTR